MGQSTIQRSGIFLILLCAICHGFPVMEDLPEGGNSLDTSFPSLYVVSNDALLASKYNLPVMNIGLSPPTQDYERPLVQELLPPMHSFQHIPSIVMRPPTHEYQPPVVKFNWKKRVEIFPDPSSPQKVPQGSKGITSKAVTSKTMGVVAEPSTAWWASVPMVNRRLQPPTEQFNHSELERHLQPPTEQFYYSG